MLGTKSHEIIFTGGGTESDNLAILGLARKHVDKGRHLITGSVMENTVTYSGGFDLGHMIVTDGQRQVRLGIYNEYMTADVDGARVATFPDMVGTLDPQNGEPVAISELPVGAEVAMIIAHRSNFPVGKGALDPAVFPEVEDAMGVDLRSYL